MVVINSNKMQAFTAKDCDCFAQNEFGARPSPTDLPPLALDAIPIQAIE